MTGIANLYRRCDNECLVVRLNSICRSSPLFKNIFLGMRIIDVVKPKSHTIKNKSTKNSYDSHHKKEIIVFGFDHIICNIEC